MPKIVIDIYENYYHSIKYAPDGDLTSAEYAIKYGTLLPQNHGKIIDVNEYFTGKYTDAREFLEKATPIVREVTCCSSRRDI